MFEYFEFLHTPADSFSSLPAVWSWLIPLSFHTDVLLCRRSVSLSSGAEEGTEVITGEGNVEMEGVTVRDDGQGGED